MTWQSHRRVVIALVGASAFAIFAGAPHAAVEPHAPAAQCTLGYSRGQVGDIVDGFVQGGAVEGRKAWAAVDVERHWASYEPCGAH